MSFNFTVVRTQALGYLATYPQGESWPGTSTLNYVAGQIVANNAAIALGATGALTVFVSGGQSDLIIDINGYYGGAFVSSVNGLDGDVDIVPGNNVTITPSGNTLVIDAPLVQGPPGPQGAQGPQGARVRRAPRVRRVPSVRRARSAPRVRRARARRVRLVRRVPPAFRARRALRVLRVPRVIRARRALR